MSSKHAFQTGQNVHTPTNRTYDTIADRDNDIPLDQPIPPATTVPPFQVPENINKEVRVNLPAVTYSKMYQVTPTVLWSSQPVSETLAQVLATGNTTGGTDIVVDTGDKITITDAPTIGADGANKTYVDGNNSTQDTAIGLNTTHRTSAGTDHSDVGLNNTHRASAGVDHSDVVLNNTHRGSDGTDHSDVVLNNTHRTSDGSDHTFIDQSVVSGSSPLFSTQSPSDNSTKAATTAYADAAGGGGVVQTYGELRRSTNGAQTAFTTKTKIQFDEEGESQNMTVSLANGRITADIDSTYLVSITGASTFDISNKFSFYVRKNGVSGSDLTITCGESSVADACEAVAGRKLYVLDANDYVEMWIDCEASFKDFDLQAGFTFNMIRV